MVLCIIPPSFRLITEILKAIERERRSARTDGQTDSQTDGGNDRRQYPSAPMAANGKDV